jgi:hypothetical protein
MKKKRIEVEEKEVEQTEFDAVLAKLLTMDPISMKKLKTSGRKGSKAPLIHRKP